MKPWEKYQDNTPSKPLEKYAANTIDIGTIPEMQVDTQVQQAPDSSSTEPTIMTFTGKDTIPNTAMSKYQQDELRKNLTRSAFDTAQIEGFGSYTDPSTGENVSVGGGAIEPTLFELDAISPALKFGLGALGVGGAAIGGRKAYRGVKEKLFPLETEASEVAKFRGLSELEALAETKGIPREDQAFSLAMGGGADTLGVIKKAVVDDGDEARRALGKDLGRRIAKIEDAIGTKTIEQTSKETSNMFSKMVKSVAKDNKNTYDASALLDDLTVIDKLVARSDISERTVKALKSKLDENPTLTLEDALEYRKEINAELVNSKGDHKKLWIKMKDNIDKFIDSNTDPKMKEFIDDAISTYARTKTNEELVGIVNKSKTPDGRAINWAKATQEIKKAGLDSPETLLALDIADEFTKKFGNDSALASSTITKGSSEGGGGVLTVFSKLVKSATNLGEKALRTEGAINREVQAKILKTILNKSKNESEFINGVIKSRQLPSDIRKRLAEHLKEVRRANRSGGRRNPIEVDIIPKDKSKELVPESSIIDVEASNSIGAIGANKPKQIVYTPQKQLPTIEAVAGTRENIGKVLGSDVVLINLRDKRLKNLIEIDTVSKSPVSKARERKIAELKAEEASLKKKQMARHKSGRLWRDISEVEIGGSEEAAKNRLRIAQKRKAGRDYNSGHFSKEDLEELQRMEEEQLAREAEDLF